MRPSFVLCFVEADWPMFRAPDAFRGVRLESPRSLKRLLTRATALDDAALERIAAALSAALPPK